MICLWLFLPLSIHISTQLTGTKIYGRTDEDGRDEPDITIPYEVYKHTKNESERKQHFLQHKGKHGNSKEAYTNGSKSTGMKVGYAAVFTDTTRGGALPEEASIHTAEMTAMKEIKERRGGQQKEIQYPG